jgi:dTDP-4-amino-4,6-dideoxygalactose transaminase
VKTQELQDMWKVPLFDIQLDQAAINAVQEVMRSGWLTMGEVTKNFERLFAEFLDIKHAIAVSNGTAALHLANMALDIRNGDEVICPSLTFVAGANSIVYVGGQPVFADIAGYNQLNISPPAEPKPFKSSTMPVIPVTWVLLKKLQMSIVFI